MNCNEPETLTGKILSEKLESFWIKAEIKIF